MILILMIGILSYMKIFHVTEEKSSYSVKGK